MKARSRCEFVIKFVDIPDRKDVDDYQIIFQISVLSLLAHCDATAAPARHIPNSGMITPHLQQQLHLWQNDHQRN
jgi:hypothetical protein